MRFFIYCSKWSWKINSSLCLDHRTNGLRTFPGLSQDINITAELNCQRGKQEGGSGSLNLQRETQALTWTWKKFKSLFLSQVVLSGSRIGICEARCLFKINTCGRDGKKTGVGKGVKLSCVPKSGQPSGVLWARITCRKYHAGHKWLVLYTPQLLGCGKWPIPGKGMILRQTSLSATEVLSEELMAGGCLLTTFLAAGQWDLPWRGSGQCISIKDPEAKLVLSFAQGFLAAESLLTSDEL